MQESIKRRLAVLEKLPFGSAPVGVLAQTEDGYELVHGEKKYLFKTETEAADFFHKQTQGLKVEPILIVWNIGRGG